MDSQCEEQTTLATRLLCDLQRNQSPLFLLPLETKFCTESKTEFIEPEKQKERLTLQLVNRAVPGTEGVPGSFPAPGTAYAFFVTSGT